MNAEDLCLGVIPCRFASTRFPGKPLARIAGKPMVQRVYEQASQAKLLSRVVVATDDQRIHAAVLEFGGESIMTSAGHSCGTERLAEVAEKWPEYPMLVNVQGDEPLISPEAIDLAIAKLRASPSAVVSTLVTACAEEDFSNPNIVKAVVDSQQFALYFSRSPIPHRRADGGAHPWRHMGLYVYRRDFLLRVAAAVPTPLERTEQLEQLRVLEMGEKIACAISPYMSPGVDIPSDVELVERILREREQAGKTSGAAVLQGGADG